MEARTGPRAKYRKIFQDAVKINRNQDVPRFTHLGDSVAMGLGASTESWVKMCRMRGEKQKEKKE